MGVTGYLIDKSALARMHHDPVAARLEPLMNRGLVSICGVTELEAFFSARNIDQRARMKRQLEESLDRVETPVDVWQRAAVIQEALTQRGQHRSAGIADLVIAATAQALRLTVLHYDRDFETIAAFTEQAVEWVVPAGSVP